MTIQFLALLTSLRTEAAIAQDKAGTSPPTVGAVMEKPLPDYPGKEVLMLTVEYPPGRSDYLALLMRYSLGD